MKIRLNHWYLHDQAEVQVTMAIDVVAWGALLLAAWCPVLHMI